MNRLLFNKTKDIEIIPIRAAAWDFGYDDYLIGFWLESGSYYSTEEITMPHYEGGNVQQGHLLKVNLIIPHNQMDTNGLIDKLETLISKSKKEERVEFQVVLGTSSEIPGIIEDEELYTPTAINSTYGLWIEFHTQLAFTYRIEQKEIRPRTIVTGEGFAYKLNDMLNVPANSIKFFN
jgi:hypothetical protein